MLNRLILASYRSLGVVPHDSDPGIEPKEISSGHRSAWLKMNAAIPVIGATS